MAEAATEHTMTEAQAQAIGLTEAQTDFDPAEDKWDWQGAYEKHFLADGKTAEFDDAGNLIVPPDAEGKGARLIGPDGVDVIEGEPAPEHGPEGPQEAGDGAEDEDGGEEAEEAAETPDGVTKAREREAKRQSTKYEKALAIVQEFADMTATDGWGRFYAKMQSIATKALLALKKPGPEGKKNHDLLVATIHMPEVLVESMRQAVTNLCEMSQGRTGELPLFPKTATATWDEDSGRIEIFSAEAQSETADDPEQTPEESEQTQEIVDEGAKSDEGESGADAT